MNRRQFLRSTAAGLAVSSFGVHVSGAAQPKSYRVGLIGTGWYGKSDLWRLIQVAPVDVVSLCDVDRHLLKGAAEMAAKRQKSGKTPRTYTDYRAMLKEKDLDIVLIGTPDHWHALQMIAAVEAGATFIARSRSAATFSKARRWSPRHAGTAGSCRSARSARARRT